MAAKKAEKATIESICSKIASYYPEAKPDLVRKAYTFADNAHQGQLRSSGDPYIIHPTQVAQTLADLRMDIPSIVAALLHDTVEDTSTTLEQIEEEFGKPSPSSLTASPSSPKSRSRLPRKSRPKTSAR